MRRWLFLPLLAVAATCHDSTGPLSGRGRVGIRTVYVYPHSDSLLVGDTLRLQVAVTDSSFNTVPNPHLTWRSTDTSAVTVDSSGLLTARLAGTVAITATAGGISGGAFVTAQWPVVNVLMPDSLTITHYEIIRFIPGLEGPTGTEVSDRNTTWTTSDPLVALVAGDGTVTPQSLGTAFITASSSGHRDSTRLTVVHEPVRNLGLGQTLPNPLLAGHPQAVSAFCADSLQRNVDGVPITWASSDTMLLTVTVGGNDRAPTILPRRVGTPVLRFACGGLQDSAALPIGLATTSVRFDPETLTVGVGQIVTPTAVFRDSAGGNHGFEGMLLQSLDTTIVNVSGVSLIGRMAGLTRVIGSGTDSSFTDTATVRVVGGGDTLRIYFVNFQSSSPTPTTQPEYSVLQGTIVLNDTLGRTPPTPHSVTLTSSDTLVARVAPGSLSLHDQATITISYGRPGVAVITARVDSLGFTEPITSLNVPPGSVTLAQARPPRIMQVGDTFGLEAIVSGTDFVAHLYPVTWSVSNPARARVDTEAPAPLIAITPARLTALAPGPVTVRASSGGVSDSVTVTIRSLSAPVITGVSPALLTPGATVTFQGSGYDPNPANDSVWVEGIPAVVSQATGTSVTAVLPPPSSFRCTPTHQAIVAIGVNGALGVDSEPLRVALPESVTTGSVARVAPGAGSCIELATVAGEQYWVTLANPGTSPDALTSFQLAGTSSAAFTPTPVSPVRLSPPLPLGGGARAIRLDSLVAAATAHRHHLDAEGALMRRLGSPARQWTLARATAAGGPALSIGARIGDTVRFHVPRIDRPDFCSSYSEIDARQVYSGPHAQIFEDIQSPVAGQMDSVFASVGQEFDQLDYGILLADFGDPLVLDSMLSRAGKITMVFSPVVNDFGVLGFVTACDFYPESVAPSSNETEVFYGPAPLTPGSGFDAYTPDYWRWLIRSTLIHESKHIVSFANRLAHNGPPEDTWLEESSAVLAEELWSRTFSHNAWKEDAAYSETLYCEVRPSFPQCAGHPYSMFNAFAFLTEYAQASETHTPLGPTSFSDASFYGSGWSLLRWSIDQYAGSEASFIKSLVQEPALTGIVNLEARTGHSFTQMSADWQLALRSDGLSGFTAVDPLITFPSWNLRNIYAGMSQDFPGEFPLFPETTRNESIPFLDSVQSLPGGTSVVLYPPIGTGSFVLQLRGVGGGAPPPLQLEILRFQ